MYNYKDKIFCVMTCMQPIEQRAFVFPAALVMLMSFCHRGKFHVSR